MGKFKGCLGFRNKEIRFNESCQRHTNGSTVGPSMFYKRTIAVLVIAAVTASAQGFNTVQDPLLYRLNDKQPGNETVVTTAAYRDDLIDNITPNDTESDQTTISWLQFMEEDAADWNNENGFDVSQHIRLKRAVNEDGSGDGGSGGIATTTAEDTTTGDFTTTTYVTEPSTESTESNTGSSGFGETTAFSTEETTGGGTMTPTAYETSQSESTTESATSLPETSSSFTVTSMSPGKVTETTEAGSGMEETTLSTIAVTSAATESMTATGTSESSNEIPTSAESTGESTTSLPETSSSVTITSMSPGEVTETTEAGSGMEETTLSTIAVTSSATESITATSTSESSTENPTSAESTVTNPNTESSTSPNELTATTQEGSGMEYTTSTAAFSEETTTNVPTESTAQVSTTAPTTAPASCASVTCSDNEYCVITDAGDVTCECIPGYHRDDDTQICIATKVFGGILHLNITFDSELGNSSSGLYNTTVRESQAFLEACYGSESWFVAVEIIGFDEGSTLVNHQIFTKDQTDVTASTIETTFSNFISNDEYFTNCTCAEDHCDNNPSSPVSPPRNSTVIANASCADAGTRTDVVCETTSNYCSTGTFCNATSNGEVSCACDDNFVQDSNTTCVKLICSSSFGCNQPFGTCDTTATEPQGRCVCMWGFQGNNCQIIWVFVLVLCIAGVVLIIIIVAIAWWCRRRSRRKASYDSNPYSNAGAMSVSLERYHSMSDWDEKIGGVVPTSYKRISDSENVDSAYEQSSASGDFEQSSEARGVTLRNWTVSEIGSGDRGSNGSNDNEYEERPVQLTTFQQAPDDSEVIGQTRI